MHVLNQSLFLCSGDVASNPQLCASIVQSFERNCDVWSLVRTHCRDLLGAEDLERYQQLYENNYDEDLQSNWGNLLEKFYPEDKFIDAGRYDFDDDSDEQAELTAAAGGDGGIAVVMRAVAQTASESRRVGASFWGENLKAEATTGGWGCNNDDRRPQKKVGRWAHLMPLITMRLLTLADSVVSVVIADNNQLGFCC